MDTFETLAQTLSTSDDPEIRADAALELASLLDQRAIEPFIQALHDEYWLVRYHAAEALGSQRDIRAVDPLLKILADSNEDVRSQAIVALAVLNDARAVEPLIGVLERDDSCRSYAASALSSLGDALGHHIAFVRWQAAEALGQLHDTRAVKPLIKCLSGEKDVPYTRVIEALTDIGTVEALAAVKAWHEKHGQ